MKETKSYPAVLEQDKVFTFVEQQENDVIVAVGNEMVTSIHFKDLKAAKEYVRKKPYELLVNLMCIVTNKIMTYDKYVNKDETK